MVTTRARVFLGAALGMALLLTTSKAEAAPLGLVPGAQDITAVGVDISYSGGVLTATLSSGVGNYFPGGLNITNLSYSLSANVSSAGVFSGGTVSGSAGSSAGPGNSGSSVMLRGYRAATSTPDRSTGSPRASRCAQAQTVATRHQSARSP